MLTLSISSLGFALLNPVVSAEASSPLLIEGDLVIPPFQTLNYTNQDVSVGGNIICEYKGTLFLKNSTLNLIKERSSITFTDSTLIAIDSSIRGRFFNVTFEGKSSATILETSVDLGSTWVLISGNLVEIKGDFNVNGLSKAFFDNVLFEGLLRANDSARLDVTDMLTPPDLETYGHSSVSFAKSKVDKISAYNSSMVYISSTTIKPAVRQPVRTFDSSRLILIDSLTNWRMEAYGSSSVMIVNTELDRLTTYDSSLASLNKANIKEGLSIYGSSRVFIFGSTIDRGVELTAYLSAYDSSLITMSDTTLKGAIVLHGASNITLIKSTIESLNTRSSSNASLYSSKISSIYADDSSSVSLSSQSTTAYLGAYGSSLVSIFDSEATLVSVSHSSNVSIKNSKIKELLANYKSINGSFRDIRNGNVEDWNSQTRTLISVDSGGYAPSISLKNTNIEFWSLYFLSSRNVTVTNSIIESLTVSGTTAYLIGSIVSSYDFSGGATAYLYWYLDVQAPSNATLNVYDSNMALVESKIADTNGRATFALLEKIANATQSISYGAYTIDVSSPVFSGQQKVEMTSNKQIVLTPPPSLWEQYWYIIIVVVAAAVSAAVFSVLFFRTRRRGSIKKAV